MDFIRNISQRLYLYAVSDTLVMPNYPSNMNLHTTSYVKDKIPFKPKNPYNRILIVAVVELLKEVT